jgi:hypothetical protein
VDTTPARLLLWSPRILGILVSLFIGMFALDGSSEGKPLSQAILAFGIHLIPAFVLLTLVAASFSMGVDRGRGVHRDCHRVCDDDVAGSPRLDATDLRSAGDRGSALPLELVPP